jgi:hypothetical protein
MSTSCCHWKLKHSADKELKVTARQKQAKTERRGDASEHHTCNAADSSDARSLSALCLDCSTAKAASSRLSLPAE